MCNKLLFLSPGKHRVVGTVSPTPCKTDSGILLEADILAPCMAAVVGNPVPCLLPLPLPLPPRMPRELEVRGVVACCATPDSKVSDPAAELTGDMFVFLSSCAAFSLPRPLVDLLLLWRPVPCSSFSFAARPFPRGLAAFWLCGATADVEFTSGEALELINAAGKPSDDSASAAASRSSSSFGSMMVVLVVACRGVKLVGP